jgi:hypothetical protein
VFILLKTIIEDDNNQENDSPKKTKQPLQLEKLLSESNKLSETGYSETGANV